MENRMKQNNLSPLSPYQVSLDLWVCLSRSEDTNLEDFILQSSITEDFYYHQLGLGNH